MTQNNQQIKKMKDAGGLPFTVDHYSVLYQSYLNCIKQASIDVKFSPVLKLADDNFCEFMGILTYALSTSADTTDPSVMARLMTSSKSV